MLLKNADLILRFSIFLKSIREKSIAKNHPVRFYAFEKPNFNDGHCRY